MQQAYIAFQNGRIEVKVQEIIAAFQPNAVHHLPYRQLPIPYNFDKAQHIGIVGMQLVLHLSCTCPVICAYLSCLV